MRKFETRLYAWVLLLVGCLIATYAYAAGIKIADMTELTAPASGDWISIVDISDTAQSADGSTRKISLANLSSVGTIGTFGSPTTTNPYTLAAENAHGKFLFYGATGTINLPDAVQGMSVIVWSTGAYTITVEPNGTNTIAVNGTNMSAGYNFTLASGAANFVTLVSDADDHWTATNNKGTLTAGS